MKEKSFEAERNIDFQDIDLEIENLVDIRSVLTDTSLTLEERRLSFINQLKNPYCFRYDDIRVRVSFASSKVSLGDLLKQYILSKQQLEF